MICKNIYFNIFFPCLLYIFLLNFSVYFYSFLPRIFMLHTKCAFVVFIACGQSLWATARTPQATCLAVYDVIEPDLSHTVSNSLFLSVSVIMFAFLHVLEDQSGSFPYVSAAGLAVKRSKCGYSVQSPVVIEVTTVQKVKSSDTCKHTHVHIHTLGFPRCIKWHVDHSDFTTGNRCSYTFLKE